MRIILFVLLWVCSFAASALPSLKSLEDSMKVTGARMFKGRDQEKLAAADKFLVLMRQATEMQGVFEFPFDSLPFIARLTSPDKVFRILNWNVPKDDGTHAYYGFILVDQHQLASSEKKRKKLRSPLQYVVYELSDQSDNIRNPELAMLTPEKWFGALYYKIILNEHKGKKYYTLLGWDGNTNVTWKKLIEVMTFTKDGRPQFGEETMFQNGRTSKRRVIFEFRAELIMTLRYEEKQKRIVFDHLAPEVAGAEGMYQFYINTFSYDAYEFKKGKWQYKADIDARNEKNKKDDRYIPPDGKGPQK